MESDVFCPRDPEAQRVYLQELWELRERCGWESQNDRREVAAKLGKDGA